nr:hypothetical protein Iba_chr03fCG2990 [Ipomoea batatas]
MVCLLKHVAVHTPVGIEKNVATHHPTLPPKPAGPSHHAGAAAAAFAQECRRKPQSERRHCYEHERASGEGKEYRCYRPPSVVTPPITSLLAPPEKQERHRLAASSARLLLSTNRGPRALLRLRRSTLGTREMTPLLHRKKGGRHGRTRRRRSRLHREEERRTPLSLLCRRSPSSAPTAVKPQPESQGAAATPRYVLKLQLRFTNREAENGNVKGEGKVNYIPFTFPISVMPI